MPAANQRQKGHHAGECRETVEKIIFWAKHDGGAQDNGVVDNRPDRRFTRRFRARIKGWRFSIRPNGRNMHETRNTVTLGRFRNGFRAICLNSIKPLAAALGQNANEVHHRIRTLHRVINRLREAQISLHRVNLTDIAKRLEKIGQIRPAHRNPNTIAALGKRPHDMAAQKA